MKKTQQESILPRLLRPPQAHAYLGMSRGTFNSKVRPYIKEIRLGPRGLAFDRHELDEWVENQASANEQKEGAGTWQRKVSRVSSREAKSGILTSRSQDMAAFAAARGLATTKRPSAS